MALESDSVIERQIEQPALKPAESKPHATWPREFRVMRQHEENLLKARWRGRMNLDRMRFRRYQRDGTLGSVMQRLGNFGRTWFPWLRFRSRY